MRDKLKQGDFWGSLTSMAATAAIWEIAEPNSMHVDEDAENVQVFVEPAIQGAPSPSTELFHMGPDAQTSITRHQARAGLRRRPWHEPHGQQAGTSSHKGGRCRCHGRGAPSRWHGSWGSGCTGW